MKQYRIADLNVEIKTNSKTLLENAKPYETSFEYAPNLSLTLSDDLLLQLMEEYEGYTADFVESNYIATQFSRELFDFNGFPINSTAVEYEGSAVLFSAPFEDTVVYDYLPKDKVFVVDNPAVRLISSVFYAYDTPFGNNGDKAKSAKVPIKSVVFVDKERFDSLKVLEPKDLVAMFMRAVSLSIRGERTKHTLYMLEKFMKNVTFYGVGNLYDVDFILDKVTE